MPRPKPQPSGLGIEDELSFGSDEDLLAEVGEINLSQQPEAISSAPQSQSQSHVSQNAKVKSEKTKSGGMFKLGHISKDKDKRKRTATDETIRLGTGSTTSKEDDKKSLAKSSLVIEPSLVESVLDVTSSSISNSNSSRMDSPRMSLRGPGFKSGSGSRDSLSISSSTKSPSMSLSSASKHDLVSLSPVGAQGGKKKGFMSSLRGLGGNKDRDKDRKEESMYGYGNGIGHNKPYRPDLASVRSRDSFGTRSDISRQHSFDLSSNHTYSSSDHSHSHSHSVQKQTHAHTLAPISMSPFQAHPPDLTPDSATGTRSSISASSSSKRPSISSFARRASVITSTSFATSENQGLAGNSHDSHDISDNYYESPVLSKAVLHKFPIVDVDVDGDTDIGNAKAEVQNQDQTRLHASEDAKHRSSLAIPPSPQLSSHIVSMLLPSFPASLSSLQSIQILQAAVIRKILPGSGFGSGSGSGMPEKEKSTSLKSLTSVLSSGNTSQTNYQGGNGSKKPIWITQQLVLTSFKVGGSTPTSTPDPNEYLSASSSSSSTSRTIAHLHLFSIPGASSGSGSSQATFGRRPSLPSGAMNDEMELERKMITHESTAGVWNEDENGRKFVMRIGLGMALRDGEGTQDREGIDSDREWIVEMRNADQLQEWIRQIKSIAVVIRAEREGHGQAIRNAYSDAIRGDDLALELNLQRNSSPSVSSIKSPTSRSTSVVPSQRNSAISEIPLPLPLPSSHHDVRSDAQLGVSVGSGGMERNPSAARAESPTMLPPTPIVEEMAGQFDHMQIGPAVLLTPEASSASTRVRSKSLDKGPFDLDMKYGNTDSMSPLTSTPTSTSNGSVHGNAGAGVNAISRIGGSLHRHAKKESWSSSASGGSNSIIPRRYGGLSPPPPPMAPPPNVPLPALPNETSSSPHPASLNNHSTPYPHTGIEHAGDGLQLHHQSESTSATATSSVYPAPPPTSSSATSSVSASASNSAGTPRGEMIERKDRLMNAFKPIPLVPELETSPKISSISDSPAILTSAFRPPTPPRTRQSSSNTGAIGRSRETSVDSSQRYHTPVIASTEIQTPTPSFSVTLPYSQSTEGGETVLSTPNTIHEYPHSHSRHGIENESAKANENGNGLRNASSDQLSVASASNSKQFEYEGSVRSFTPSIDSRSTTNSSARRRREKKVAVDIMSEFSETPDAAYQVEGEEEIKEDRPRVIRFA
ncbi:uncharacterized protein I303_102420 [Kwoniella dejecticola CBS 10117]|uniref:Uncharacterized protein n=1 Tax=Kwoniella dejecticola CBS 10117 TaxID=1296121 RepID=A0AAJ8MFY9_9TREE